MKFILLSCIAISALLYSCDKNEDQTNYLDNKIIEGTWYGIFGIDSTLYTFKNSKADHEFYAYISKGADGFLKYEGKEDYGNYLLTDSLILLPQSSGIKFIYRLSNQSDSLYIANTIDNPILWIGLKKVK